MAIRNFLANAGFRGRYRFQTRGLPARQRSMPLGFERLEQRVLLDAAYPNDPGFYHTGAYYHELIETPEAWSEFQPGWGGRRPDGSRVLVAVIDSGTDYTHPDLGGSPPSDKKSRDTLLIIDKTSNVSSDSPQIHPRFPGFPDSRFDSLVGPEPSPLICLLGFVITSVLCAIDPLSP